jgi:hypothetical protein
MPKETLDKMLDMLLGQFGINWRALVPGGQMGKALNAAVLDRLAKGEHPLAFRKYFLLLPPLCLTDSTCTSQCQVLHPASK